jgi:carbamoyltransferase
MTRRAHHKRGRAMNILGINAVYHESAAAVLVDGELVAAAEEERFNRIKRGKNSNVDNPHQFPHNAIRFCLDHAGLRPSDIDHVAYSFDPRMRRTQFRPEWWPEPKLEDVFLLRLAEVRGAAERVVGRPLRQAFHFVPHHLAHAASAYFPSGFDRAAILTIDGLGEAACSALARADGTRVQMLETFNYPHSLGFVWEQISSHLGFDHHDASKIMGLAAYGNPEVFREQFKSIIRVGEDDYAVEPENAGFPWGKPGGLERLLGQPRFLDARILPRHADIAAALQEATDAAVLALVRRIKRHAPVDKLCMAGGVALNCVTNDVVRRESGFSDIFIPCAPHDAGTTIGAAMAVHAAKRDSRPVNGCATPYLGPAFSRRDVLAAVKNAGLTPQRSKAPARDAAEMIAAGKIVAWFQGRMEFGPRALGNRSLLADPRRADMRNILNQRIKHRENFRPFAPSAIAEQADEWFEVGSLEESRIHAVRLSGETCAARPHPGNRASRRHRSAADRAAGIKSALSRAHLMLLRADGGTGRHQHLVQRQRADCLHTRRRDRHLPQERHRRPVHGRCLPDRGHLRCLRCEEPEHHGAPALAGARPACTHIPSASRRAGAP